MTKAEKREAEKQAERDAEWLGLILLTAFRKNDSRAVREVSWNPETGRFRYKGKLVSVKLIREYLLRIEQRIGNRLATATERLERGEITLQEWQELFERDISSGILLAGGLALGSIGAAANSQLVLDRLESDLDFADQFTKKIRQNKAGSFRMIKARARRYMQAAHIIFQQVEHSARRAAGKQTEAKRIRRAAESCKGCIHYAGRWILIDKMPMIGTLDCKQWCRCYLIYR